MRRLCVLLLACFLPLAYGEGLPDLGEAAQGDLPPATEKRIGENIMREIRLREPSYLDDPEVAGYVNRLGGRLVAQTRGKQEYEFFVLRDPSLNAFAMPGGFIGVHSGLILAAQSESELAGVLGHEISHVTQHHLARGLGKQSQAAMAALLSMAVAILAARNNPDFASGAIMAGQAAGIQHQLNYSRDFEREADRLGVELLERADFDVRGMPSFFERLQKYSRLYENNAPGYLRTHPLTTERIADMENRVQEHPYRQVPDSLDFRLVKAKLRAQEGTPEDAVHDFTAQIEERKFPSEIGARYGLAVALARAQRYADAETRLAGLRKDDIQSPFLDTLAAQLRLKQDDAPGAAKILQAAAVRYPQERSVAYALVEALLASNQAAEALKTATADLQSYTTDARMHELQARAYAKLGKQMQQHRALAEAYALRGQTMAAIDQLQLAQKAPDGNYYEHSQVDARLREFRARKAAEDKEARQPQ